MIFLATGQVAWALNTPKCVWGWTPTANVFLVYLEAMNVSGDCKCRPISVKRNLKVEANAVVSECTVCYFLCSHLLNSVIIFIFYFRKRGILTPENIPLQPWCTVCLLSRPFNVMLWTRLFVFLSYFLSLLLWWINVYITKPLSFVGWRHDAVRDWLINCFVR